MKHRPTIKGRKRRRPEEITEVLALLTHEDDVEYMEYIRRLSVNRIAVKVKIADLDHNMDLSRLDKIEEKDRERYEKYQFARAFLLDVQQKERMKTRKVILYEHITDISKKTRITAKALVSGIEVLFVSSESERLQSTFYAWDRNNTEELARQLDIRKVKLLEWMQSKFTGVKADEEFADYCAQCGLVITKKDNYYSSR